MQGWGTVAGWRKGPEQELSGEALHGDGTDQRRLSHSIQHLARARGGIGIILAFMSLQRVKMPCRRWPEEDDDDEAEEEEQQRG